VHQSRHQKQSDFLIARRLPFVPTVEGDLHLNTRGDNMQFWQIVVIGVAAVIVIAVAGWLIYMQRRRRHLRERFGPEYDRTVTQVGDRGEAEAELVRREQRVRNLKIRPLSVSDRIRLSSEWMKCQTLFVDDPATAVDQADELITEVLRGRGYAVLSPYDRMTDISAAYPRSADDYRAADEIVTQHHRGQASTEDLRKAFIHYRRLFDEILGGKDEESKRAS